MNSEYWEKRLANVVWNSYNTLEEQNMALLDHYNKTMNNIRAELIKLDEQKALTRSDKYRVQHLKSIQEQILKECEKLGDSVENDTIKNVSKQMQDIYKTSFSSISNDKFSQLSKNVCKDIINTPWQGSSFSERLWGNTGKLVNELNNILATGITEGKTISEMAFQLSNRMHKDMNVCHRLVRTETINSLNRASMRGMIDAGVKYVRWWAAQDERACDKCGANHGKPYPIDKAPNLPCHPGCRCTWLPVFEDELSEDEITNFSADINKKVYNDNGKDNFINQYKEAQNIDKAKEYATEVLGLDYVEYEKFNTDIANMVNKEISKIYDTFGDLKKAGYLNRIMIYPKKTDAVAAYVQKAGVIYMKNVKSKTSLKMMKKNAFEQFDIGFWSTGDVEHAIRHELGHAIEHMYTDKDTKKLEKISFLREGIKKRHKIEKWDIYEDLTIVKKVGEDISYYALYDDGEFIAESVAEYMSGKPRQVAKKVIEILLGDD